MSKTRGIIRAVAGAVGVQYKIVAIASAVLASLVLAYSGYAIYDAVATQNKAYGDQSIMKYKPEYVDGLKTSAGDTEELEKAIKDYVGWLTVDDTHIDYPVVQGTDDMYYAAHDVYGESSLTGAIYLSCLNNRNGADPYNIIYGHHMQNGAMFGQLFEYKNEAFYSSHKTGVWITKSSIYELKCFAVAHTDAYNKDVYAINGRPISITEYLRAAYNHDTSVFSAYNDSVDIEEPGDIEISTDVLYFDENHAGLSSQVLALSTCDTDTTNGRVLVFWAMIPASDIPTYTPVPTDITPTPSPTPRPTATPTPTKGGGGGSYTPRVTNTPEPTNTPEISLRKMSVRYVFADGTEAAPAWSGEFKPGEEFSIPNPNIPGYVAVYSTTTGTMPDREAEITVIYIAESLAKNGSVSCIDQFEKNPNAIHIQMQLGLSCE